jgi:AraC family transcriptional regulator of adaptative response/methylated-DNA-[protein]-cysteine methyltransferase
LKTYKSTFHAYQRMYLANNAYQRYKTEQNVTKVGFDSGYDSLS